MDWQGLHRAAPPPLPASQFVPQGRSYLSPPNREASETAPRPTGRSRVAMPASADDAGARRVKNAFDRLLCVIILLAVAATSFAVVSAITPPASPSAPTGAVAGGQRTQAARLVQSTLGALHDANRTGNYVVFRLLAAPAFQVTHSAEDLARIFAGQRQFPLDLAAISVDEPEWDGEPVPSAAGVLRLAGSYPATEDLRLRFDFSYQRIDERWRLLDIETTLRPASIAALVGMRSR